MSEPYDPTTPSGSPYGSPAGPSGPAGPPSGPPADDIVMAGPGPGRGRRNMPAILTSIAIVMALIIGGVAYGAYQLLASHGDQPEKWAPASSVAFVKVDLDPSASEKVAVYKFAKHFPDTPDSKDYGDLRETIFEKAFEDAPVDWKDDVKPWLGDRVGVAVFPYHGSMATIGIIQHTDKAKAQAALTKAAEQDDSIAFAVEDGYAIVGESQGAVDEAVKEARSKSLADNADFSSDLDALPSDRVLAVWADLPALTKQMNEQLESNGAMLPGGLGLLGLGATPSLIKGRVALAVSVQSNYVELEARAFGADNKAIQNGKAGSELAALPSHTVLGLAVAHPDNLARTFVDGILKTPVGDDIHQQLEAASEETGFDLPDDAYKVLGSSLTLALQSFPADEDIPEFEVATKPSDMDVAKRVADFFASEITADAPVNITADNGTLRLGTKDYDTSGKLADSDRFRAAMGDLSGDVALAGYIDLHAIWQAFPGDVDANAKQLSAVGFVAGTDSTPYLRLRVAVG